MAETVTVAVLTVLDLLNVAAIRYQTQLLFRLLWTTARKVLLMMMVALQVKMTMMMVMEILPSVQRNQSAEDQLPADYLADGRMRPFLVGRNEKRASNDNRSKIVFAMS